MFVTIASESEEPRRLEVHDEMEIEILQELVEIEYSIPKERQVLSFEGKVISSGTLKANQIGNDSMIFVQKQEIPSSSAQPMASSPEVAMSPPEVMMGQFKTDPRLRGFVRSHPELERALAKDNKEEFKAAFEKIKKVQESMRAPGGEMSEEAQRYIQEQIERENIDKSLQDAYEHNPESFAEVIMLFAKAEVNGKECIAFIDTGAQNTIMSLECAKRLGLDRLIDKRYEGVAIGVGSAKILGRVHSAVLRLGDQFLHCTFKILEDMSYDIIFGLDMLRKHTVIVDLEEGCLRIHGTRIEFLPEREIPDNFRPKLKQKDSDQGSTGKQQSAGASSSTRTSTAPTAPDSTPTFPEDKIRTLMNLGFDRDSVIQALAQAEGNEELAANVLLAGSKYGF